MGKGSLQEGMAPLDHSISTQRATAAGMADGPGATQGLLSHSDKTPVILIPGNKDGIKVSMRSKTDSNVLEICQRNGGGGHVKAAGCTMHTSMENAFGIIKGEMETALS